MDRIENRQFCADCQDLNRSECCQGYGAQIVPSDIVEEGEEFTDESLEKKINDSDFPMTFTAYNGILELSLRMRDEQGEIVSGIVERGNGDELIRKERANLGYKCVALGAGRTGCRMSCDDRPYRCAVAVCSYMAAEGKRDRQMISMDVYDQMWNVPKIQAVMRRVLKKAIDDEIATIVATDGEIAGDNLRRRYIEYLMSKRINLSEER